MLQATEIGLNENQRSSDTERAVFTRMLMGYGYSRAELMLAMREVPRDPERFGGRQASLQDVERVVSRHRSLRVQLTRPMSTKAMNDLCVAFPGEIDPDGFRCCGFDSFNNPLWRYAPNVPKANVEPMALLPEKNVPEQTGRGGTLHFGEAMTDE